MTRARKKDANHNAIVGALRDVGAEVFDIYQLPKALDILVAYRGVLHWVEVKDTRGTLTPDESALIERFARVGVVLPVWRSVDEALKGIGAIE